MLPGEYLGLFTDIFQASFSVAYSSTSHPSMHEDRGILHSPGMQPLHAHVVSLFLM